MQSIQGKTALVTGASSGIGECTVKRLLQQGVTVFAAARRLEKMRQLKDAGALLLNLDISDKQSVLQTVEAIQKSGRSVDILFMIQGLLETKEALKERGILMLIDLCDPVNGVVAFSEDASLKEEYTAGTLRPKILHQLNDYLVLPKGQTFKKDSLSLHKSTIIKKYTLSSRPLLLSLILSLILKSD